MDYEYLRLRRVLQNLSPMHTLAIYFPYGTQDMIEIIYVLYVDVGSGKISHCRSELKNFLIFQTINKLLIKAAKGLDQYTR